MANRREVYLVEGMSGEGCEEAILQLVSKVRGLQSAEANLREATVTVEYDPDRLSVGDLKSAFQNMGYKIAGERPPYGQRESSGEGIP